MKNTALLLIDLQNDYFEGGTMTLVNADAAVRNARLVLEKFRMEGIPVIHVQHIAKSPDATFFLPDTVGAQINKSVQPATMEKLIVKHFPNSFRETGLSDYLKEKEINTLVICGMMTHMCIDATTRAAKDLGFTCILLGDACATKDLKINEEKIKASDVHNSFLAALNTTYAQVLTIGDYLAKY
ncbi:MAG: cysteine hydrolase family protein [Paludibacter sp.]|jgi:nicotinamidase-related amidase|nr:cysteine hydrolase family protein [Paludibacter sp.]